MAPWGHNPSVSQLVAAPREWGWHDGGRSGVFCWEKGEIASQLSPAVAVPAPDPGDGDGECSGEPRRVAPVSGDVGQQAGAGAPWERGGHESGCTVPVGSSMGKGRGDTLPLPANITGTPWSLSPPSPAQASLLPHTHPPAPGSVSYSHRHPQRAELDAGTGGRLHREPEGGSLPALAGVRQCHRRHPLLPWCVAGGSCRWQGLAKGSASTSHHEMQASISWHWPWGLPGTCTHTVPNRVGVSSLPEPATSPALGIPLPRPLPWDSPASLTTCLPPAATPWRAPNKIDLYDVRRRPW